MIDYENFLGSRVLVTIEDTDIEDTEGYQNGDVTYHLGPSYVWLLPKLQVTDIAERFKRHRVYLEIAWTDNGPRTTVPFNEYGLHKLVQEAEQRYS